MSYINKYAVLTTAGKLEEAFLTAKQGYEMDPDSMIGNRIMGFAYFYKKQYAEATEYLEFASKLSNYAAFNQVDLIKLYTAMGLSEKAGAVLEDLKLRVGAGKYVSSCIMSFAYGFLGDIDEAFNWLERAYEEHDAYLCILQYYPFLPVRLRQDSRFKSFTSKMNFPE
jgi:tetratricopeptide (TPR) repeat protein